MVSFSPLSNDQLESLSLIRSKCQLVHDNISQSQFFSLNLDNMINVEDYIISLINRDYNGMINQIPPHGRWQHFGHQNMDNLLNRLSTNRIERLKSLIDLTVISVLLDAGAGNKWKYHDNGKDFNRSEGVAIACLRMFEKGLVSSSPIDNPYMADSKGLKNVDLTSVFQCKEEGNESKSKSKSGNDKNLFDQNSNMIIGLEGRRELLGKLSEALVSNPKFFGSEARPGNMIDYLLSSATKEERELEQYQQLEQMERMEQLNGKDGNEKNLIIDIKDLWEVIVDGLGSIWSYNSNGMGDVWMCSLIKDQVPFHKLSQWLCYSLIQTMQKILPVSIRGMEFLTGLAEYRNGGLFIDMNVIKIKNKNLLNQQPLPVDHEAIIEWRALTIILIDKLWNNLRKRLGKNKEEFTLAMLLEAGTWKAGREVASATRVDGTPPLNIISNGNLF